MAKPVLSANSPVAGSIAWTAFNIRYNGASFAVSAGNTALPYVWWRYNGGVSSTIEAGLSVPTDLTIDDLVLFANKSGIPLDIQSSDVVDGGLVVSGSIFADAIAANAIEARHISALAVTADKIATGDLTADVALLGSLTVGQMTLQPPAGADPGGLHIPLPNGGQILLPADGLTDAVITAILRARQLVIEDNLRLLGILNSIEGSLEMAYGVVPPAVAPRVGATWSAPGLSEALGSHALGALWEGSTHYLFADGATLYTRNKTTGVVSTRVTWPSGNRILSATKMGSSYYVLLATTRDYPDFYPTTYIYKFDNDITSEGLTWDWTATWNLGSANWNNDSNYDPVIYSDGTTMWICRATAASHLAFGTLNLPVGNIASVTGTSTSTEGFQTNLTGLYYGAADFGANRVVITWLNGQRSYSLSGGVMTRQTANEWSRANNEPQRGITWDGTRFRSLGSAGKLWNYSQATASATRSVTYSKYDNDPAGLGQAETQASPAATYVQPARSWMEVLMEPPGDAGGVDDPNALRVYIGNQRQPDLGDGVTSYVYGVPATGGPAAPVTNGFVSTRTAPGSVMSAAADGLGRLISLNGAGAWRLVGLSEWTAYTPTIHRMDTGAAVAASGTPVGRYLRFGDTVIAEGEVTFAAATTGGAAVLLPVVPATRQVGSIGECALWGTSTPTDQSGHGYMTADRTKLVIAAYTAGFRDAVSGHTIRFCVIYKVS